MRVVGCSTRAVRAGRAVAVTAACLVIAMLSCSVTSAARIPLQGVHVAPWRIESRPPTAPLPHTPPHERPHAHALGRRAAPIATLNGVPATAYTAIMGFGNPTQNFSIVIDTGSSNLAVAASASAGATSFYNGTSSLNYTSGAGTVSVTYLLGSWSGSRVQDVVALYGSGVAALKVEFAAIMTSSSFYQSGSAYPFIGILGLAYANLAFPTAAPITPYFDSLVAAGLDNTFSLQLCDGKMVSQFGRLILVATPSFMHLGGGAAAVADLASGPFYYTPLTQEKYYGVSVARMAMGGVPVPVACSLYNSPKAIVDSGTTDMLVPPAVFTWFTTQFLTFVTFQSQVGQDAFFAGQSCVGIANNQLSALPNITVTLVGAGGTEFDLVVPPAHYLRAVSVTVTLPANTQCRTFGVQPMSCGTILGAVLMNSYTVVFDRAQQRVGFATSTCSNASGFGSVSPIISRASNASCGVDGSLCASSSSSVSPGLIAGVTVGVSAGVLAIALISMKAASAWGGGASAGASSAVPRSQMVKTSV